LVAYEQSRGGEEEDEVEADGANYQLEMMRCLREVNVDNNTVGWYDFHYSMSIFILFPRSSSI
jgi:hypothetical protein